MEKEAEGIELFVVLSLGPVIKEEETEEDEIEEDEVATTVGVVVIFVVAVVKVVEKVDVVPLSSLISTVLFFLFFFNKFGFKTPNENVLDLVLSLLLSLFFLYLCPLISIVTRVGFSVERFNNINFLPPGNFNGKEVIFSIGMGCVVAVADVDPSFLLMTNKKTLTGSLVEELLAY